MRLNRQLIGLALLLSGITGHGQADTVSFLEDIKPILETKCLACHNPNLTKGDLSMATHEEILDADPNFLIAGNHLDSILHQVTVPLDPGDEPEMPKEGDPLTDAEAGKLAQWIDQGAEWPDKIVLKEASKADKSWWAYQPLKKSPHKSIDTFIDARLAEHNLSRNPPAPPRDLVRRIYYDLIGLPPTPNQIKDFLDAHAEHPASSIESLVTELLASPHYGERWGRHWLDVVRFGESRGFEKNILNDNIWPFRDYVIRSLNEDKPFDQFIIEHLAGDVVGKDNPDIEVGTAFLVAGTWDDVNNRDPAQQKIIRANTLDDPITATGSAFLGLTINCAKCHDHKFDPIEQADYFRILAAFDGLKQEARVITTPARRREHAAKTTPLKEKEKALSKKLDDLTSKIIARGKADPEKFLPKTSRPKVDRTFNEDTFPPTRARFVRLVPLTNDVDAAKRGGIRFDEFEIWTAGKKPRNVALSKNGGRASADSRFVEDSADNSKNAYGPVLVNDGKFGRRWISSGDHILTIELAKPETFNRIVYSSDRPADLPTHTKMTSVGEYRLESSLDGEEWTLLTESWDREPLNAKFLDQRFLRFCATEAEDARLERLNLELGKTNRALADIPPLPTVWAGKFSQPEHPTHIAIGGDPNKPGNPIVPASLTTLSDNIPAYTLAHDTPESERRLALAKWIVHPGNPLTPRVLANRIWHYHFGTGIVNTPSDFGYMGGKPSHPDLLDYLASRLIENKWQLKALHKEIILSQTYQQATTHRDAAAAVDADARLLWRFPPRRLSAEEMRDTILSIAGQLDPAMGGPGFRLYKFTRDNVCTYHPLDEHGHDTYRRAVYHQNPRAAQVDLLTEFDCPDPAVATPRRASTTTPLQALTLMNHSFTIDMANRFADRLSNHSSKPAAQVRQAFLLAFGRPPGPDEKTAAVSLINSHGLPAFTRALLNANELIYLN
ncbi:MAG: DUF1553 domain-containing protein [Verrucomicrobiota bacterium]